MICRKGTKYEEKIMNTSKSAVSLMFACTTNGQFLPYVIYKVDCLINSWIMREPISTRYNRTKSRWHNASKTVIEGRLCLTLVNYQMMLQESLSENLCSHHSADVIEVCEPNWICMIFLPPNSTHLLQPLDMIPMKAAWWKVLTKWKQIECFTLLN